MDTPFVYRFLNHHLSVIILLLQIILRIFAPVKDLQATSVFTSLPWKPASVYGILRQFHDDLKKHQINRYPAIKVFLKNTLSFKNMSISSFSCLINFIERLDKKMAGSCRLVKWTQRKMGARLWRRIIHV